MRLRLAVSGIITAGLTLIVLWILLSALVRAGAIEDQASALEALAQQAGTLSDLPPQVAVSDPREDTSAFVVLANGDGSLVYSGAVGDFSPRIPAALIVEATETGATQGTFSSGGVELRLHAVRWERPGREPGVAAALQSTAFVDDQIAGAQTALGLASVITLFAAAVVSWAVAGRALRPLNTLIRIADEIQDAGDLRRRLQPARRKDEVQRLTASFNGMLDRLEASTKEIETSLDRQRRFVADASHELRTPLTTIRSNAGFLAERPDASPDDRVDAAADIVAEADRMARLVGDLLTLARSDAEIAISTTRVDLHAIALETARQAGDHVSCSGESAVIDGNFDLLTRLLWILVDNALIHGSPPVTIEVSGDGALTVSDEGPGIPLAERERIFDRFHRADWTRATPGAGLGLAIAREIAKRHGGSISAESSASGGARIEVRLPVLTTG